MMRPSQRLYQLITKRDGRYDGKFYIGVLTTGIYCLPSCTAKTPKIENVRLFRSEADAKAAGLRACLRCRPDLFARGENLDEEAYRRIVAAIVTADGATAEVGRIAARCGVSKTKATELARMHGHASIAGMLRDARVRAAARRLFDTNERIVDVCFAAGFESEATFHRQFTGVMGLSPGAYRGLRESMVFALKLPAGYRSSEIFAFHGRGDASPSERVHGSTLTKALVLDGRGVVLEMSLDDGEALCRAEAGAPSAELMLSAHAVACRMLGFRSDTCAFERLMRRRGHERLVAARPGLRIPLTASPFEALTWAVIGQQITVRFAATLRRALIEAHGSPVDGLIAHPDASKIAKLDRADLLKLQFSRQKATYLIGAAQAIEAGRLPLDTLRDLPASRAYALLTAMPGIGPWTAQYTMMRGAGFGDCVPVGDSGLRAALQRFNNLVARPNDAQVDGLMSAYRPHRSLATAHLWASLNDA